MDVKLNTLTCDICNRSDITTEAELSAHKKLHHAKSKMSTVSLQCAYCREHCKSRSDLENHMKIHQISCGKGKHKCNICDEIYSSAITLADHKLTHCKIVSGNSCTQCKAVINDEQAFYSHQLQHSSATGGNKASPQISLPANCVICCQTLQTDVELKLHAKFHLRNYIQKDFMCGACNKIFDSSGNLKITQGIDKSGGNIPMYFCKDCLGNSSNGEKLSSTKFKDVKQFACVQCTQVFDNEEDIQSHAQTHLMNDGNNLECHLCRNVLPTPLKLQAHLIEHNFIGIGQYTCYICSSVFTTATGLQSHIIGHGLNHRLYECAECKMKFFFCTELENHKFAHVLSNQKTLCTYGNANGEGDCGYDYTKNQKRYISCEGCNSSVEENSYSEHLEICSTAKIKQETSASPIDANGKSNEIDQCQEDIRMCNEIKRENVQ